MRGIILALTCLPFNSLAQENQLLSAEHPLERFLEEFYGVGHPLLQNAHPYINFSKKINDALNSPEWSRKTGLGKYQLLQKAFRKLDKFEDYVGMKKRNYYSYFFSFQIK